MVEFVFPFIALPKKKCCVGTIDMLLALGCGLGRVCGVGVCGGTGCGGCGVCERM